MTRVRTSAASIRENMPFDQPGTLTDQQAFDVAAHVSARPRPDFPDKIHDWPNGDAPPDVAYPTLAAQRKSAAAPAGRTHPSVQRSHLIGGRMFDVGHFTTPRRGFLGRIAASAAAFGL